MLADNFALTANFASTAPVAVTMEGYHGGRYSSSHGGDGGGGGGVGRVSGRCDVVNRSCDGGGDSGVMFGPRDVQLYVP